MDRPTRMKFLPKKLCDNEKDSKETFQCSYCNSNYARKASLNTHIKQKHQEDEPIPREAPISSSTEAKRQIKPPQYLKEYELKGVKGEILY